MSLHDYLFHEEPGVTLYCGDAIELLPLLDPVDAVVTDPVWPNRSADVFPGVNAEALLGNALFLVQAKRVVLHLGCGSDPRILAAVPERWPFIRVCWLEFACPGKEGRLLKSSDVAYVFGEYPPIEPGRFLMRGWALNVDGTTNKNGHPSPRRLTHVQWLVSEFARGPVLDPFAGSGTTLEAAKNCGLPAIGIEIEPRYCEIAVKRLRQEVLPL